MIYDSLQNWRLYFKYPIFEEIFSALAEITPETPNGMIKKHDDFYFNVMSYDTEVQPEIVESHQREVDIQIVLQGEEQMQVYDRNGVKTTKAYNPESDCEFYEIIGSPLTTLVAKPSYMAVFFPQDIHYAKIAVKGVSANVKKVVVKVKKELF